MKKFALTALAAAVSIVGFASVASADSRNRGDDEWPRHGQQDDRNWNNDQDRDRGNSRHADRGDDNGWRGDRDHDRDRWRRDHWRPAPRWHGPRVVIRDEYCFVKKVRRYDDWGNMYVKRVRICR